MFNVQHTLHIKRIPYTNSGACFIPPGLQKEHGNLICLWNAGSSLWWMSTSLKQLSRSFTQEYFRTDANFSFWRSFPPRNQSKLIQLSLTNHLNLIQPLKNPKLIHKQSEAKDRRFAVRRSPIHSFIHHLPPFICRFLIPTLTVSTPDSLFTSVWFRLLTLSHGCCTHCWAVGRFSGSKSRRGQRNLANSWASISENLNLSISNFSKDPCFSLRILFKSPYLSK